MKALSKEIYSKSTICDFLVNSNRGRITFRLKNRHYSRIEVESRHFCHYVVIVDSLAEEHRKTST